MMEVSVPPPTAADRDALAREIGLDLSRLSPARVNDAFAKLAARAQLLERLTIRETHLLRHPEHFAALAALAHALPGASEGALRAWSAGCASGEEAYSLAAVLGPSARVLGTDLIASAVETARRASYRMWSLRGVDLARERGWLHADDLGVEIASEVRARAEFHTLNLASEPFPTGFDVVFCRNVLLYFEAEAAGRVHEKLYEAVRPGGVLFIGPTDPEPPARLGWRVESSGAARWFRRPQFEVARFVAPAVNEAPREPPRALARAPAPQPEPEPDDEDGLDRARALCDSGDLPGAREVLEALIRERPLDPAPRALLTLVAKESGDLAEATTAARSAVFLAPDAPCANYLLAACLRQGGHLDRARIHLQLARERLRRTDLRKPLPLIQGLTGYQLSRMIDVLEHQL